MTIVKWDPFKSVSALQNRINQLFEDSFPGSGQMEEDVALCAWRPAVDIYDTEDAIVMKAELPGIDKEDISVEIKGNVLILSGERRIDTGIQNEQYYRRERATGRFHRAFTLRDPVPPENVRAKYKDGVLTLEIPKLKAEKPKQITVDVD